MKLPDIPYKDKIKKAQQTKFGGLNLSVGAGDGEICDMLNMVSNDYPVLSSRPPRYTRTNITADNGLIYIADEAYYVNGTTLYHDGTVIGTLTDSKKKFAVMPYYLIIFPDKKAVRLGVKGYYATLAALETAITSPGNNDIYVIGTDAYYWTGTEWKKSGKEIEPMESTWSGALSFLAVGEYAGVVAYDNTLYSSVTNWEDYFRVGDAVTISGCTKHTENNMTPIIREIDGNYLRFYENVFTYSYQWIYKIENFKLKSDDSNYADMFKIGSIDSNLDMTWKIYCFDTDEKRIIFTIHSAESEPDPDADSVSVIYAPNGYVSGSGAYMFDSDAIIFRENKLYHRWIGGNLSELSHFAVWKKVSMNAISDGYKSDEITIDSQKLYFVIDDESYYITITDAIYLELNGDDAYFTFDGTNLICYYSTGHVTLAIDSTITWDEALTFASASINHIEAAVTLKRTVPDMDFIFCNDNRLWGCKDDTIYASKLGDPFNFNVMDSLSTDSYTTESGTHGDFTGVISYLGYPLFFKEDHILKIYGTKPSDFQIYDTSTNGVKAGSEQSLAVAGETLYYQSKSGIMAYTGATPSLVSVALGNVIYKNGIAGSDGSKYFIDLTNGTTHYLFVYDPLREMWHKEAPLGNAFIYFDDELWSYDGETLTVLSALSAPSGATKENEVEWSVEFADFTGESPNRKGISRFYLRCEVTGTMDVYIQCDGGEWVKRFSCENQTKRSLSIPIIPQRADHYRIELSGKGEVKVYSLTTDYYVGSEN